MANKISISIYEYMGLNAALMLAYKGSDPLKVAARKTAEEAVAFTEERLGASLSQYEEAGDEDCFFYEVGVALRSAPAEILKVFAGREGAKVLLARRADRRRHSDRRGLDAHRNHGWGYILRS